MPLHPLFLLNVNLSLPVKVLAEVAASQLLFFIVARFNILLFIMFTSSSHHAYSCRSYRPTSLSVPSHQTIDWNSFGERSQL